VRQSPTVREVPGFGRPALLWALAEPGRCVASAVLGGGIGERSWIANVNVSHGYDHPAPAQHASELGAALGCVGPGCCLLTGVDVRRFTSGEDEGVEAFATVGLGAVTWAADEDGKWTVWRPGTINCVVFVPAPLTDAALVNLVSTVTEAKVQALLECHVPGTGTASDAVVVCAVASPIAAASQWYGGPRSLWGARVARAVRRAVVEGVRTR
jgi:adenosylcobinamide hydrolase